MQAELFQGTDPLPRPNIFYRPDLFAPEEADRLFARLAGEIAWREEWATIYGRKVRLPRLVAWHGDPHAVYSYSGLEHRPEPWTDLLNLLKALAEREAGIRFNSVLLNFYRHGQEAMGWHSDDEPELGPDPVIASLSFGAARRFLFRSRPPLPPARREVLLGHGSCLVMRAGCQRLWQHALPKAARLGAGRINLTFRHIEAAAAATGKGRARLPGPGESAINRG